MIKLDLSLCLFIDDKIRLITIVI